MDNPPVKKQNSVVADISAGLTTGISNIPDAMAMAILAGANPISGLYALMVGTPVGALLGSSVFMNISVTSAMALTVGATVASQGQGNAAATIITLTLLVGVVGVLAGIFKLGRLMRFVSNAVMIGFLTGVSIQIVLGQLPALTGYTTTYPNSVVQAIDILLHPSGIQGESLAIGLLSILIIVMINRTRLSNFSMLFGMVIPSLLLALINWTSVATIGSTTPVPSGFPRPALPDLTLIPGLFLPAISIAIVGLVQGGGISKGFSNPDGTYPDISRDFTGSGAANIAASLFQGMPVGGSISTTALNRSAGAKTRMANVFSGLVIALTVLFFSSQVNNAALPAMAGVLIMVGLESIRKEEFEDVWHTGWGSRIVMAVTLAATLTLPVQYAVLVGVVLSGIIFIASASTDLHLVEIVANPDGTFTQQDPPAKLPDHAVTLLGVYGSVFYAGADRLEEILPSAKGVQQAVVIMRLREHTQISSTFINVLERYQADLQAGGGKLILTGVSQHVKEQLDQTEKTDDLLGEENIYLASPTLSESTMVAYRAAQKWLEKDE